MELYTKSLVNPDSDFTLNKKAPETIVYSDKNISYSYPLDAINIYSQVYAWTSEVLDSKNILNENNEAKYLGPACFSYEYVPEFIRPNGFIIYKLGIADEDEIKLTLTEGNANQKNYLYAF